MITLQLLIRAYLQMELNIAELQKTWIWWRLFINKHTNHSVSKVRQHLYRNLAESLCIFTAIHKRWERIKVYGVIHMCLVKNWSIGSIYSCSAYCQLLVNKPLNACRKDWMQNANIIIFILHLLPSSKLQHSPWWLLK